MARPPTKIPAQPAMFPDANVPAPQTVPVSEVDSATAEVASWSDAPRNEPERRQANDPAPAPTQPPVQPQTSMVAPQPKEPVSFEPRTADEMYRYAKMLARSKLLPSGFYPKGDWGKERPQIDDVHFVLLKGQALGLHPMTSIGGISIIDGKAEVGSHLMVALCLKSGLCEYFELISTDERQATYATKRRGGRREIQFTYTIEMAERLGLLDKGKTQEAKERNNWRLQPDTMLRRRAQSHLCREVFSDTVLGLYDHDELSEMRAREIAIGIDPDRVISIDGAAGDRQALSEATQGPIDRMSQQTDQRAADPLKARLAQRAAQSVGGLVRRCSSCKEILDPRDSDPCIACRPDDDTGSAA